MCCAIDVLRTISNLYTFFDGKKTRLTSFDSSVKRPFVAASVNAIVFEKDYQLYLYDVAAKKSDKIGPTAIT